MRTLIPMLTLLALSACDTGSYYQETPLWDTQGVATDAGVYFTLPAYEGVAYVTPDGTNSLVDLDGASPEQIVAAPDGETVLIYATYPSCKLDDEAPKVKTVADCEDEDGEVIWSKELVVVRDGEVQGAQIPVPMAYNALTFTSAGNQVVAWLDYQAGDEIDLGTINNLNQVMFVDLDQVSSSAVTVGHLADRILFDQDDQRAVILSRSQVMVVDMATYEATVTFPLSLDVDDAVTPNDVALTPDGRYALITIQGSGDLYVLDLEAESINLVSLDASPTDMAVNHDADLTSLVYKGRSQVDLLDHELFELETVDLEEPSTDILNLGTEILLFNSSHTDSFKDLYRLDLGDQELVEYRAENPVQSLQLSPDQNYAVAITWPEGGFSSSVDGLYDSHWGVEIFDMSSDKSVPLIAAAQPVGLAFAGGEGSGVALVLIEGEDELMQIDLASPNPVSIELEAAPEGIGAVGERFYITHDSPLGMVSFLDTEGNITIASGFAAAGFLPVERALVTRED